MDMTGIHQTHWAAVLSAFARECCCFGRRPSELHLKFSNCHDDSDEFLVSKHMLQRTFPIPFWEIGNTYVSVCNRTQGVGIHGMEIYFPRYAVKQSELEEYMGAGKGKFTIG